MEKESAFVESEAALVRRATGDGSPTFYSPRFAESFHSLRGAYQETMEKFIAPLELVRRKAPLGSPAHPVRIFDFCLGLGYNLAGLLRACQQGSVCARTLSCDLSLAPLRRALQESVMAELWSKAAWELVSAQHSYLCPTGRLAGEVRLGDVRHVLAQADFVAQHRGRFHGILYDPFSPRVCPELWSEECLGVLVQLLAPGGKLITYGTSAALRHTLKRCGLVVFSTRPGNATLHRPLWSQGTVALKPPVEALFHVDLTRGPYGALSPQELEHLGTRAAIPYQDPFFTDSRVAIHARRRHRQQQSQLPASSAVRRHRQTHT